MRQNLPKVPGCRVHLKKGRVYIYHRATGERLYAEFGTPEFAAELLALDRRAGARPPPVFIKTLGRLIDAYRDSEDFQALAPRTRADYQDKFNYLQPIAMMPLSDLSRAELMRIRDKARRAKKFHFANYLTTVLRLVLKWGVDRDWLPFNPAVEIARIERPKGLPQRNRAWTQAEKDAVLEAALGGIRTGIALGMFAAMREGDMLGLEWSAVAQGWVRWVQGKTGDPCGWPVDPVLAAILEEARLAAGGDPLPHRRIVVTRRGEPYTADGFRAIFFRLLKRLEAEQKIGPGLTFHGLRHSAGRELVEQGGTPAEVQSRLGHRTLAMANHYSREFDRDRLASSGAAKIAKTPAEVLPFPGRRGGSSMP